MTREEAIKHIRFVLSALNENSQIAEAYRMAIKALDQEPSGETVSLEAFKQVMWERDIAIEQLKELGYGFGQKIEPCNDAISRQAVLDGIDTYIYKAQSTGTQDDFYSFAELVVKQLPSVNPQEPKTGHWIEHPEKETSTPEYLMFYECSECGDKQCFCKSDIHKKRFCSNCGCRMVEPQESEEV